MKTLHKIIFLSAFIFLFQGNSFAQIFEGTHFIGTGETYNNFTDALGNLGSTLTGNVIFEVRAGTYNEQIVLPDLTGGYSVTFRKADGETGEVLLNPDNFSLGNYVVQIDGSHYHFENISFQNSSTADGYGRVIEFGNNYIDDIWFSNCIFTGRTVLSTEQQSDEMYSVIYYNNTSFVSNINLTNSSIIGGSYGININTFEQSGFDIKIKDCNITDFSHTGINFNNVNGFLIEANTISDIVGNTNNTFGINIETANDSLRINANTINLTSNNDKTGIKFKNISTTPFSEYIVSNNMITTRTASDTYNSQGIWLEDCSYISIINNSIHIQDGATTSSAFKIFDTAQTSSDNLLLNNLLINTGGGYSMFLEYLFNLIDFNNNDYFSSGTSIINSDSQDFTDLSSWQYFDTQNPIDLSSFSAMPHFVSITDLHIDNSQASYIESRGIHSMVSTDIDGDVRDIDETGFVDVGADEGNFNLLWTGDINDQTFWHDTVFVENDITINPGFGGTNKGLGGNLMINPGTFIKFMNSSNITVEGSIYAAGTEEEGIVFTSEGSAGNETWGGIISHPGSPSSFEFCKFENASGTNGGAFFIDSNNDITIRNCSFVNNYGNNGGAINTSFCSPTIDANLFYNNTATNGGAIYSTDQLPIISNNIFVGNNSTNHGGAIFINNTSAGPISFMNNTFYNNSATGGGDDLYLDNTQIQIYNSIFWSDFGGQKIEEVNGQMNNTSNCIIKNGFSGTNIIPENNTTLLGNDPLFVDPANMNFSVQANSVAVDGGSATGYETQYDYAGNSRIYGTVDIGAYELQAPRLFADAGEDMADCYNTQYLPDMYSVYPYQFEWTILNNDEAYLESTEGTFFIKNLPPSTPVDVKLSVTNGFITENDTLTITNTQPIANAGDDVLLINSDINNNVYSDVIFNANTPNALFETGMWTQLSAGGLAISDVNINNPTISGILYGQHMFEWKVLNMQDETCFNTDTVLIVAGHSYSSVPDGTFDWATPSDWQEGALPGPADSVTIYGVNGNINLPGAVCDRLYVGNGGTLNIFGTAKAPSSLSCRTITVEENAKKFKGIKGAANLYIKDNSTLNIGSEYVSKARSTSGSGLFIGNGGTVFIRPNAEKGAKASAGLNIGSGGFIFIRPNAEKGAKASAGLNIGSGGFVFIRPNAEKSKTDKSLAEGDIVVGAGGALTLEETIAGVDGGYLELSGRRTIYISPSTAKAAGGNLGIYGGTIFIRPNAEKNAKGATSSGIFCGRGGTIFIRPNAEKATGLSRLVTPVLDIDGGKVVVGNNVKTKAATGRLSFNQIFIRPNAEKGFANDTALIIYPSGELALSDSAYMNPSFISIAEGEAVSFLEGSTIEFENQDFMTSQFDLKEGSSLIDMNPTSNYDAFFENRFLAGKRYLFSPSVKNLNVSDFGEDKSLGSWEEATHSWQALTDADILDAGNGYFVTYNSSDTYKILYGKANTGDFNMPATLTDVGNFEFEGWNLFGNPYPSAIDLDMINLPVDFYNTFYIFNPTEKQFMLYQQGGVSINGASQFVNPNQAFIVKTDANSMFNINNDARVHFFSNAKNTNSVNNVLKLKVSGIANSDETAIIFNQNATDNFDKEYDAAKFLSNAVTKPVIYTKIAGEDAPIAINTFEYVTNTKIIPLYFETLANGPYSINVSELNFDPSVTVFLKDLNDNSMHDLKTNPTYNFTYSSGDTPNRFEIIFDGFVGVEDVATENNLNIFSNKNTIFINSDTKNSRVEVYNLNGQLLLQKNISNLGLNSVDVNLPQSIYLVKVITDKEIFTTKVSISK